MSVILSQTRWPSLALDLAIMTVPGSPLTELNTIYETYSLTQNELREILNNPYFQQLFNDTLEQVKAQGNKAGAAYRAMTLSQALSEKLFRDANGNRMEPKDMIKFYELLLKSAGLLDNKDTQVNTQVNVGVALPLPTGLNNPKLKHTQAIGTK